MDLETPSSEYSMSEETKLAVSYLAKVRAQMDITHVWSDHFSSYIHEHVSGATMAFKYNGSFTRLFIDGEELAETGHPGDPFQVALALTARVLARVDKMNEKFNVKVKQIQVWRAASQRERELYEELKTIEDIFFGDNSNSESKVKEYPDVAIEVT